MRQCMTGSLGLGLMLGCALGLMRLAADELPPAAERARALRDEFSVAPFPRPPSAPGPLAQRALTLARQATAALRADRRPWQADPPAHWLTHRLPAEPDRVAQALLALAVVSLWGESEAERTETLADLVALLRCVAATPSAGPLTAHAGLTGAQPSTSARWAFQTGQAAWMIWDRLDPELQWLLAHRIATEADRLTESEPTQPRSYEPAAELMAGNTAVVALAANLFPRHPRREAWDAAARRGQLAAFLTPADVASDRGVAGKPLRTWGLQANLHPDYTLKNPDRVQPGDLGLIALTLAQRLSYQWSGRPVPETIDFNIVNIYNNLKFFSHPDGRVYDPNGPAQAAFPLRPALHAWMNVGFQDAEAAYLERAALDTAQRMRAGLPAGGDPSLLAACASDCATLYLIHRWGNDGVPPVSADEFLQRQSGVRSFDAGQFVVQRTRAGFVSFSWGNRGLGQAMPFGDLAGQPPECGWVGLVSATENPPATNRPASASAAPEQPVLEAHQVHAAKDYFAVSVRLARAGGLLEQQAVFLSLSNGWTIYIERFSTRKPATVGLIQSGLVGLLAEPDWGQPPRPRRWAWPDGEWAESSATAPRDWLCPWLNLDQRWGFITRGARGFRYEPNPVSAGGRREPWLYLEPPPARAFDADEIIAQRALFVGLNQTVPATAALAKTLEAEGGFQTARLYFRVDQWMIDLDFDAPLPQVNLEAIHP